MKDHSRGKDGRVRRFWCDLCELCVRCFFHAKLAKLAKRPLVGDDRQRARMVCAKKARAHIGPG